MSAVCLAAAIVLEICGTTALKLSNGFTWIGPLAAVVVCYVASFALLSLACLPAAPPPVPLAIPRSERAERISATRFLAEILSLQPPAQRAESC